VYVHYVGVIKINRGYGPFGTWDYTNYIAIVGGALLHPLIVDWIILRTGGAEPHPYNKKLKPSNTIEKVGNGLDRSLLFTMPSL
jgi:hypothetical protein